MRSKTEEDVEPEKEIPMYCCLEFSFAVYYKFITIGMDRNSINLGLKDKTRRKASSRAHFLQA
jgi:hypothetical protein